MKTSPTIFLATRSSQETRELGRLLAQRLRGGEVIALIGELGAGKTVLVKGLAAGLGIRQPIRSPTFLLLRVYPVRGHRTIKRFVHVDAYRIKHPAELLDVGLNDNLGKPDTVTVIEWANRAVAVIPRQHTTLILQLGSIPTRRHITLRAALTVPNASAILRTPVFGHIMRRQGHR